MHEQSTVVLDQWQMTSMTSAPDANQGPPIERQPSRRHRRAIAAIQRRQHARAAKHSCVLHRDCVDAGVAVEVAPGEYHAIHQARGERECAMCPTCQDDERRGVTRGRLLGVDVVKTSWQRRLRHHQEMVGIAALCVLYGR